MSTYFTAAPTSGQVPLEVTFSGIPGSIVDPVFIWDFDDGGVTATGQLVQHTYNSSGIFNPFVTISSGNIPWTSGTYSGAIKSFWDTAATYSDFYDSSRVSLRDGEGVFVGNGDSDAKLVEISGNWRLTAELYVDHSAGGNDSIHLTMSGVTHWADVNYSGNNIHATYDGGGVATSGFAAGNHIGVRMVNQPSGAPTFEEIGASLTGYYSSINDEIPGPSGNVTERWIQHRIRIVSSGVYVGSDLDNSGTISDYFFSDAGDHVGYSGADNFSAINIYIPHAGNIPNSQVWVDDIYVQSSGVTVASGTWDDGSMQGWQVVNGFSSGTILSNPVGVGQSLTNVSGAGPIEIYKTFDTIERASGEITVLYKTLFDDSYYDFNSPSWTELRQFYVRLYGSPGYGIQTLYRPLNFIKDQTNTEDFRSWVINYTAGGSGSVTWWVKPEGGSWGLLHSGAYSIDDEVTFYMNTGNEVGLRSILVEADEGLPENGYPYSAYDTWFYDDFDSLILSGILNDTFQSGVHVNLSGRGGLSSGHLSTNDRLSDNFSGDFDLVSRIYSNHNTESHGWRIVDADDEDDYLEISYARGPDDELAAVFHYDDPTESAVYQPSSDGLAPWWWWGRLKRTTDGVGNQTFSVYWASGDLPSPSESDWMLVSGVSEWTVPTGTFDNVYLSLDSAPEGVFQFESLEIGSDIGSGNAITELALVTVSGTEFLVSGDLGGWGSIVGGIIYTPAAYGPPPAGSPIRTMLPVLSNRRTNPYYAGSRDRIQSKFELYNKHRLSYQPDLPVELWMNYDGAWAVRASGVTNRYGMVHFSYPCSNIPENIDCCLGVAKVNVDGTIYNSNIVRYNFVNGVAEDIIYDIDAAWQCTSPTDRSAYDIFDGSGRVNIFDRMYGGS